MLRRKFFTYLWASQFKVNTKDNITLKQLINFVTFAETGSVKVTAQRLKTSENHVRKLLHYLNEKFDNRLLEIYKGDGQPAQLTSDGRVAVGHFEIVIKSVQNVKTYLNETSGTAYPRKLF